LHELGFKYAKINGNKKALVERKDLVNKRIISYVQLSKKYKHSYRRPYNEYSYQV
jgi:hypothetical protein